MYAVIETGGKQYKVTQGDVVYIEKLEAKADEVVQFSNVALIGGGTAPVVGNPHIAGAAVTAKVLKNGKAKKITVFTYKAKKNSKRKQGHRQPYTKVEILEILQSGAKEPAAKPAAAAVDTAVATEAAAEKKAPATKKPAAAKTATAEKKPAAAKTATAEKKPAAAKKTAPKAEGEAKPATKKTAKSEVTE